MRLAARAAAARTARAAAPLTTLDQEGANMWAIEAIDSQKGIKPEVIAYFCEEKDAKEYAEYLATVDVEAKIERIRELHYTD